MAEKENTEDSILIAHLADTHLRDTQYATARRGLDFFEGFKRAVEVACDKADVLVLVGDIFDRARPSPRVIKQLMELHQIIKARRKVCFAVTGNHDWCDPTWLSILFPHDNGGFGIEPIDGINDANWKGWTFAGIHPYTVGQFRSNLADVTTAAKDADVVLYHGLVDGVVPFFIHMESPLHCDEFPISKNNKAWLLGDIHMQGYVEKKRPGGTCLIGYPGSTEMCSASENPEKSVPILKLTKEKCELVETVPIETRPFVKAEVTSPEELDALMKRIEPIADKHPVVVVKFVRTLTETINRLHSMLDAQRAVIRCYPLPETKDVRARAAVGEEELDMQHFVARRFKDESDLQKVALDLLARGEEDTEGIVTGFIERSLTGAAVREDD